MLRREFIKGIAAVLITVNTTLGFRSLSAPGPIKEKAYHYMIADGAGAPMDMANVVSKTRRLRDIIDRPDEINGEIETIMHNRHSKVWSERHHNCEECGT